MTFLFRRLIILIPFETKRSQAVEFFPVLYGRCYIMPVCVCVRKEGG